MFSVPSGGKYVVTTSGVPLTNNYFGVTVDAPATATLLPVNDGDVQRSRVPELKVEFSKIVTFVGAEANAFELTRTDLKSAKSTITPTVFVDNSSGKTVATLTFTSAPAEFGSLPDGVYSLRVIAAEVNGMTTDYTAPTFHRLFGDINGNGKVTVSDYIQFDKTFGLSISDKGFVGAFDYNQDGKITATDYIQFDRRFGASIP
jgi:hypothetical protein